MTASTESLSSIGAPTGIPEVGIPLTVGSLVPSGATASYQWTESATSGGTYTNISGATASTYTPVGGDATKYIEVVATGIGNYTGTVTSAPVGPVASFTITATGPGSWTVPAGVTSVSIDLWGAGGGGGGNTPGTAAAYVHESNLTVTPGQSITYNIATGGIPYGGGGGTGYQSGGAAYGGGGGGGGGSSAVVVNGTTYIASGGGGGGSTNNGSSASGSSGGSGGPYTGGNGSGGGGGSGTAGGNGTATTGGVGGTGGTTMTNTPGSPNYGNGGPSAAGASGNGNSEVQWGSTGGNGSGGAAGGTSGNAGANGSGSDSGGGGGAGANGGQPGGGAGAHGTGGAGELVIAYTGGSFPLSAIGSITGTPQAGVTLTAGSLVPSGATASYQWTESATSGGTYTNISGATASTYTPVGGDVNKYIEVVATGTGSYTGTVTSTPVGPVAAPAAATTYTLTGPTSGTVNVASANFTVTPNGLYTGTITPTSTGAGTFSPTSLTWSNTSTAQTFTYTPTSATGSPYTISTTNSTSLINPSSISYTVNGATGYQHYVPITVTSNTSIASGTQSNFPMLVSSTFSQWKSVGNGGHIQNLATAPNGGQEPADLIYSLSSSCTSPLNFETESYNSSTGALVDWVNVPTMQAGQIIYVCYGNSSVTTDQSNPSSTWNSNYVGVWHLPNGTTLSANNSVSGVAGTINGPVAATTGQIDGGGQWGGHTTDAITTDVTTNNIQRSYSIWTYETGYGGGNLGRIFDKRVSSAQTEQLYTSSAATTLGYTRNWTSAGVEWDIPVPSFNAWHYVVVTYDDSSASNVPTFYVDGVAQTITATVDTPPSGTPITDTDNYVLGNRANDYARNWGGSLDEFRIANTILPASWVKTEYDNQSAPGTFYTMGSEQGTPITAIGSTTGTLQVGSTLTAGSLTPSGATASYQWEESTTSGGTYTNISGATSSTYVLVANDVNQYIKVVATGTGSYTGSVTSAYVGPVTPAVISAAAITGVTAPVTGATPVTTATNSSQYTATVSWSPAVSGTFAPGTTYTANITVTPATGYTLTGVGANFFTVSGATESNSAGSGSVSAVFPATGSQSLSAIGSTTGTLQVGSTLTAGSLTPSGATASYQWEESTTSGGTYTNISGATSSTYVLVANDVNQYIKVVATGTGSYTGSVTSAYVGPVTPAVISAAAITGVTAPVTGATPVTTATNSSQYTATVSWSPAVSGTFAPGTTYTANITVTPATGYTLTGVGANFFTVSGATESNSAGSGSVSAVFPATGSQSLSAIGSTTGTLQVGSTLTAGSLTPSGATASYQWEESTTSGGTYTNISGATSSTYVLVANDVNQYIKVVATGTGSYTGSVTSAYVGPVVSLPPTVTVQSASSVATSFATLNGNLTATGAPSSTIEGFNYGTSTNYGLVVSSTNAGGFTLGSFSYAIIGLAPNTTYHYQAYATNVGGRPPRLIRPSRRLR